MSGVAKHRLYIDADGKVVAEDDPAAAFLLAAEGDEIPEGYDVPAKFKGGTKEAEPAANKAVSKPSADKAAK